MSYRRRFLSLIVAACCVAAMIVGDNMAVGGDSIEAPGLTIDSRAPEKVTERIRENLTELQQRLRRFLPPQAPATQIKVIVYATLDEYREALKAAGVAASNPACFVAAQRTIFLAYDGARFDVAQRNHRKALDESFAAVQELNRRFAVRQREDEARFKRENTPVERRKEIRRRAETDFQRARASFASAADEASKQAERAFDEALRRLMTFATHEFFHAYVAIELFPTAQQGIPAWLDEGLAQVVEFARWTQDDRPQPQIAELARQWREAGLSAQTPPSLESILRTDSKRYLMHDPAARDDVLRSYVAAWSLATFLVQDGKFQDRTALRRFAGEIDADPVARFERFVGEPLGTFEDRWRAFLRRNRFAN